jgi:hypothetical protein
MGSSTSPSEVLAIVLGTSKKSLPAIASASLNCAYSTTVYQAKRFYGRTLACLLYNVMVDGISYFIYAGACFKIAGQPEV